MKIQVTRDENVAEDTRTSSFVDSHVNAELQPFESRISNVNVHLSLVTGETSGGDEQRCHIEVVGEGIDSITANDDGKTFESAVRLATDRMVLLLTSKFGPSGDRAIPA